jgi:hypothetical protein
MKFTVALLELAFSCYYLYPLFLLLLPHYDITHNI